jgi:hypothetical protein
MKQITKLKTYDPIIGDDDPITTIALRDVPQGYHFKDLVFPARAPLSTALKERLTDFCERHYRNYEIVGVTIGDWYKDLQLCLDVNIDNFEKFLEVYNDDIAKPVLGRDVITEHNENEETSGINSQETRSYDLPVDNIEAQEVSKDTGDSLANGSRELHIYDKQHMSDVGVTNNWEKLNGFLDNNPSMEIVFTNYFKNCFTLYEVLKW